MKRTEKKPEQTCEKEEEDTKRIFVPGTKKMVEVTNNPNVVFCFREKDQQTKEYWEKCLCVFIRFYKISNGRGYEYWSYEIDPDYAKQKDLDYVDIRYGNVTCDWIMSSNKEKGLMHLFLSPRSDKKVPKSMRLCCSSKKTKSCKSSITVSFEKGEMGTRFFLKISKNHYHRRNCSIDINTDKILAKSILAESNNVIFIDKPEPKEQTETQIDRKRKRKEKSVNTNPKPIKRRKKKRKSLKTPKKAPVQTNGQKTPRGNFPLGFSTTNDGILASASVTKTRISKTNVKLAMQRGYESENNKFNKNLNFESPESENLLSNLQDYKGLEDYCPTEVFLPGFKNFSNYPNSVDTFTYKELDSNHSSNPLPIHDEEGKSNDKDDTNRSDFQSVDNLDIEFFDDEIKEFDHEEKIIILDSGHSYYLDTLHANYDEDKFD